MTEHTRKTFKVYDELNCSLFDALDNDLYLTLLLSVGFVIIICSTTMSKITPQSTYFRHLRGKIRFIVPCKCNDNSVDNCSYSHGGHIELKARHGNSDRGNNTKRWKRSTVVHAMLVQLMKMLSAKDSQCRKHTHQTELL